MSRDSGGTYTRVSNSFSNPVSGTAIDPTDADSLFDEIESEMTDSLCRSGKGSMLADLSMGGFAITTATSVQFKGSSSGFTLLKPTAAASGTVTLPAATDTLVGKATTDILSNKTIDTAGPNTIKINGNTLSATAGSATVTVPNSTDTLVGKATTDILTNKTLDSAGTGNVLKVSGVTVSAGNFPGATSNVAPTAGNFGEPKSQNILIGSAVSLTTTTPANIATITLTAGNWLIWANPSFTGGASTTVTGLRASISTTTATESTVAPNFVSSSYGTATVFATFNVGMSIAPSIVSLSGSQQYWLVARADFGVSTCSAFGQIAAVRLG